jgi:ABC-type molybdenum transport system ATPase subunit/photorepair protein PhrA
MDNTNFKQKRKSSNQKSTNTLIQMPHIKLQYQKKGVLQLALQFNF